MLLAIRGLGGNVATTIALGLELVHRRGAPLLGSVLQHSKWDRVRLPKVDEITFAGWDVVSSDLVSRAREAGVVGVADLATLDHKWSSVVPRPAPLRPHDADVVIRVADQGRSMSATGAVEYFAEELDALLARDSDVVAVNLASTESLNPDTEGIGTPSDLWCHISDDSDVISGGLAFAVACVEKGVPYFDFTPDMTLRCPGLIALAEDKGVPVAGKDGNTGQTFLKTVLAEMMHRRGFVVEGWYSTNVLGNGDGRVLVSPGHRETKIRDKIDALSSILPYDFLHVVDISFDESRGDNKEAWDSVLMRTWLGHKVQLKVNWLASDSALAAPMVLDIARLLSASNRNGESSVQRQLSCFFKAPVGMTRRSLWEEYHALEEHYIAED